MKLLDTIIAKPYERRRALIDGKADINVTDCKNFTPLDVANQHGHDECGKIIMQHGGVGRSNTSGSDMEQDGEKTLIISTGDISDIDGFFALAEYAKTGSDVLFIMNYPAYINVSEDKVDPHYHEINPGLGFRYSARQVHEATLCAHPEAKEYIEFMDSYNDSSRTVDHNERMKRALTDLAFAMSKSVWEEVEVPSGRGDLMFCIGGINSVNPFSERSIKHEVLVYSKIITPRKKLEPIQGYIFNAEGVQCLLHWTEYSKVYMDFNGSMAFWNGYLATILSSEQIVKKIMGVFIMGGVYSETTPVTMPSIPGVLNRFSSATMNQLYHPRNTADFFAFLKQFQLPTWTVSNNSVGNIKSNDDGCITTFLSSNDLDGKVLRELAFAHYQSVYKPPTKPYDYYCAVVLTSVLKHIQARDSLVICYDRRTLFYSNVYGITFLSHQDTWEATRAEYIEAVKLELRPNENDDERARQKLEFFRQEVELMKTIDNLSSLAVNDVSFTMDDTTMQVKIVRG